MRAYPSLSRLDRFIAFIEWEDHFPDMETLALARLALDHKHILLKTSYWQVRKAQFMLERYWFKEDDFMDTVARLWNSHRQEEAAMTRLVGKLKYLAQEVTKWGANKTLSGKATKDRILEQLEGLDALEKAGLLDELDRL